jgi:sulfur transfer complex TusBCD TusB component (DsrH family)
MPESLDLRKNIPHPVACFALAKKLMARGIEIDVLRSDKPLQIVRITDAGAGAQRPAA